MSRCLNSPFFYFFGYCRTPWPALKTFLYFPMERVFSKMPIPNIWWIYSKFSLELWVFAKPLLKPLLNKTVTFKLYPFIHVNSFWFIFLIVLLLNYPTSIPRSNDQSKMSSIKNQLSSYNTTFYIYYSRHFTFSLIGSPYNKLQNKKTATCWSPNETTEFPRKLYSLWNLSASFQNVPDFKQCMNLKFMMDDEIIHTS